MALPTQPLRDEHAELWPRVEGFRTTARQIEEYPPQELRLALEECFRFLEDHLAPHAGAEDEVLYPAVAKILGAPTATATMSRDHVEVMSLANALGVLRVSLVEDQVPSPESLEETRRILYGLYALLKLHFAKEEEIYLPLLDASLTAEQARDLFAKMEAAASRARPHAA